jgi:hypothetical protein
MLKRADRLNTEKILIVAGDNEYGAAESQFVPKKSRVGLFRHSSL